MNFFARALAATTLAIGSTAAFAHSILLKSAPMNGGVLTSAPAEIQLHFNEPVEAAFTTVTLLDASGQVIKTDKAHIDVADPKGIVLALPAIPSGGYRAQWSTMGHDGHRVKGEISFSVK